jgi:hypothetical protein
VRAYPVTVATNTTVYYLKVPADLSAGGDIAIIPTRFHDLIVDGAVLRAYMDSDNFQEAEQLQQIMAAKLENMRSALLTTSPLPDLDDYAQQTVPGDSPGAQSTSASCGQR